MKCQYQLISALAAGLTILFSTQASCLAQSSQSSHFKYIPGPGMPSWTQSDRTAPPVAHTFYVSKQTGACPIGGFVTECADEGRVANISITVNGPLIVNPTSISLTGPPCPVYDSNGYRYPAQPAAPVCQSYTGSIEPAFIPEPGTSVSASITGRDDGYWTTCSTGEQHGFGDTTIQFNIVSLLLELSDSTMAVDSGQKIIINATKVYPPELEVAWKVLGDGLQIVTQTANSVTLLFNGQGKVDLEAIIQAGCAVFKKIVNLLPIPDPCAGGLKPDEKCFRCDGRNFVRPKDELTACRPGFGPYDLRTQRCCPREGIYDFNKFHCYPCGKNPNGSNIYHIRPDSELSGCCDGVVYDMHTHKCVIINGKKQIVPK